MTTANIVFENDGNFTPSAAVTGNIQALIYTVWTPTLYGSAAAHGAISIIIPQKRNLQPLAGQVSVQGGITATVNTPPAAFKDFTHYPYQGVDPAMAMLGANNAGTSSGATGTYTRPYTVFTAPNDYPVSNGAYAWKRAAYTSVGFKFANMPASNQQLLDAVQTELAPIGATVPSPYSTARALQVIVKPTRLNYATNPNIESGITGYSAINGASITADTYYWQGSQSLKTSVPANSATDGGYSFTVTGLIPGRTYTLSAHVAVAVGCGDITAWVGSGGTQKALATFDNATPDPNNPRWRTVWLTFTTTAPSLTMGMNVLHTTMAPNTASLFWTDGVLVEEGTSVRTYFDGSMGSDYLWETGGAANASRSYFYENRVERGYLVQTLLNENTPLGIAPATPQYAVLPTA